MHQNTLIVRQRIAGGERLADPRFGDIHRRRHLRRARLQNAAPGTPRDKFWIRLNVQSYPEFIPGCTGSRVLESGPTQMTAAVDVSKAGISKTFTTRNTLTNNQSILMHLVDGPLHCRPLWRGS